MMRGGRRARRPVNGVLTALARSSSGSGGRVGPGSSYKHALALHVMLNDSSVDALSAAQSKCMQCQPRLAVDLHTTSHAAAPR